MEICHHWLSCSNPKHNFVQWSLGQSTVQYILMVGIASVAIFGVVQARFSVFQNTMESVKSDMAQLIGGNRRLPKRWFAKEAEDYSVSIAQLQSQKAEAGGASGEDAPEGVVAPATETPPLPGSGEDQRYQKNTRGFYDGASDSGFGGFGPSRVTSPSSGSRGGKAAKPVSEAKGTGGGSAFDTDAGSSDRSAVLAQGSSAKRSQPSVLDDSVAKKQSASEAGVDEKGSIKKATGEEVQERKEGKMKLDWTTVLKLVLIVVIIVLLVIMLLSSVGGAKEQE